MTIVFVTHDIDEAVYIGDRVIALGGEPGGIVIDMTINKADTNTRANPALAHQVEQISAALHTMAQKT